MTTRLKLQGDTAAKLEANANQLLLEKENLGREVTSLKEKNENYLKRGTELSNENAGLKERLERFQEEVRTLRDENTRLKASDEQRRKEYDKSVENLNKTREDLIREKEEERMKLHQSELDRFARQKDTWRTHEEEVKNRVRSICQSHTIEYIDQVPFRGKPDNTVRIANEYIVLDAKSPANDDLGNFPKYLKTQAENALKYVKEENVRREVFLVVPSNTLEVIQQFILPLGDYTVYIISIDAIEPILVSLQKIEEYEFAEQLSPDERENICRVLGKFAHLSKRRIQVDTYFTKQFFELVYRSEADLPKEIREKVQEFEKSERLNPPVERRHKQISISELKEETDSLNSEATQKGILVQDSVISNGLNKLPLYPADGDKKGKGQEELFS